MRAGTLALCSLSLFSPTTLAWGKTGHAVVATIAQKYLTPQAQSYVSGLLGSGVSMASVASWADDYRYTTAGRFSAGFHYVDAEDNPPSSCSVAVSRDCGGSCILTAIANYVGPLLLVRITPRTDIDPDATSQRRPLLAHEPQAGPRVLDPFPRRHHSAATR